MIKMVLFFVLIIFVGQYIIVFICQMMAKVVASCARRAMMIHLEPMQSCAGVSTKGLAT